MYYWLLAPLKRNKTLRYIIHYIYYSDLKNNLLHSNSTHDGGGVLPLSDDVMAQLREEHPSAQEVRLGSLLFGPVQDVPDSIYQQKNGEMVWNAAVQTKCSGSPSRVDANGFRRILASKSYKKSVTDVCAAIAAMTRRLCTEFINPLGIEAILANRITSLDKGEGTVRPIGVGEVIRRIMGKCVMHVSTWQSLMSLTQVILFKFVQGTKAEVKLQFTQCAISSRWMKRMLSC